MPPYFFETHNNLHRIRLARVVCRLIVTAWMLGALVALVVLIVGGYALFAITPQLLTRVLTPFLPKGAPTN